MKKLIPLMVGMALTFGAVTAFSGTDHHQHQGHQRKEHQRPLKQKATKKVTFLRGNCRMPRGVDAPARHFHFVPQLAGSLAAAAATSRPRSSASR